MSAETTNSDFSQRVVIATREIPWMQSPQRGVERRLLDRIGDEVARATTLVRYAPGSSFPEHDHALGEEFLVLDGVFSDEYGNYPVGTYVRNPPGSHHAPRTALGCIIFVKLRQMRSKESERVVVDTSRCAWETGTCHGHERIKLFAAPDGEEVTMERLEAGTKLPPTKNVAGEEILVIAGDLQDETGSYAAGTWIRNPPGYSHVLGSAGGAVYWVKRGHLQ
jgi:anti-sigma factor ChrR (cupin superfamily)